MKRIRDLFILFFVLIIASSCAWKDAPSWERGRQLTYKRMGFFGFLVPIESPQAQVLVQEPIGGTYHYAEYVSPETKAEIEALVWEQLQKRAKADLLAMEHIKASLAVEMEKGQERSLKALLVETARKSDLDAILIGNLYRFREREGSDFAVSSPASVSFDLYLIEAHTGSLASRYTVDLTQKSLSENLLGLKEFRESGLRWVKVRTLFMSGLSKALDYILGMPQAE